MKFLARLFLFLALALTGSAISIYKQQLIDEVLTLTDAKGMLEGLRQQNVLLTKAALNKTAAEKADQPYIKQLTARALEKYEAYSKEAFGWSRWEPRFSAHYDEQYTDAQLKTLIAFMKTDAGKAMLRTQAALPDSLLVQLTGDRSQDGPRIKRIIEDAVAEVAKEVEASNAKLETSTFSEVEEKARSGDPVAQLAMGEKYKEGKGVAKDPTEAIKWFRMAADQGDTNGMRELGAAYMKGEGFEKDPARAREYFAKGAEAGDFNCMYLLGWLYVRGEGGPKDAKAAFPWLLKAAHAGHPGAQEELAIMYWNGDGVEKSPSEAYAWVTVMEADNEDASGDFGKFIHRHIQFDAIADGGMRGSELKREIKALREGRAK